MLRLLGKIAAGAALIFGMSSVASAQEHDSSYLRVGVGYYDALNGDDEDQTVTGHAELISGSEIFHLNPFLGVMGTGEGAGYVYAGVRYDWYVTDNIIIAPSFAPGIYADGNGKDLGHSIEFRSAIEVAYEFDNNARIGASLYHLSNAGIGDSNPGTEVVTLHYSHPIGQVLNVFD
ncbi:acyloxyacyl hydrolase [Curvivirga sp.]|uniref:acyloxyacyl hydrolase n=1 Tax=Curvivirga sp. TaxID=2856848 RepID=UPI003B5A9B64